MIMKNLHISMAFIFVLLLITASCSDKDDSELRSERKSLNSIRWPTLALIITLK